MTSKQGGSSDREFVEALVELQAEASVHDLVPWCARHDIDVVPMSAGALITGSSGKFAEAFGVARLENRSRPQTLPVPATLSNTARSVTVLPIPTPGARDRNS
ncbi:hypothetical protein O1Q96_26400 [Streptomyces sp. Qhu-G9]|uniref:hypothetical protein n=1 Tax=Streptomyces sp. Qhu-G9 TaxID=3452799 RepID=UPI0022AC12BC|nr:hypothetical protein [Streptomyces aurantiacus]WAU82906.1 hypothetical protein O1Q96_26400 [Streptomyces aurantiacus]